jgi:Penicillin-insensitive murein endopeptidase
VPSRRRPLAVLAGAAAVLAGAGCARGVLPPDVPPEPAPPAAGPAAPTSGPAPAAIGWRSSVALGLPHAGRLVRGVQLPAEGVHFFTWDPVRRAVPNRAWRRWGADGTVRTTLRVLRAHRRALPGAPRLGIGDLSRPRGGDFGTRWGRIGHVSHQNGLDVDVYYPRLDRRERAPARPPQVDLVLAQDLVDRFVAAGAEKVFVGPSLGLRGPPGVVQALANHDNHLHARFPPRRGAPGPPPGGRHGVSIRGGP